MSNLKIVKLNVLIDKDTKVVIRVFTDDEELEKYKHLIENNGKKDK